MERLFPIGVDDPKHATRRRTRCPICKLLVYKDGTHLAPCGLPCDTWSYRVEILKQNPAHLWLAHMHGYHLPESCQRCVPGSEWNGNRSATLAAFDAISSARTRQLRQAVGQAWCFVWAKAGAPKHVGGAEVAEEMRVFQSLYAQIKGLAEQACSVQVELHERFEASAWDDFERLLGRRGEGRSQRPHVRIGSPPTLQAA